jgi:hypothetical protein
MVFEFMLELKWRWGYVLGGGKICRLRRVKCRQDRF